MVPGIKLTNPPLKAENTFLWLCGTLKAGDYANVHCYWQVNHAGDMENDNLGASYGHVLDCGRPVIVSEVNAVPASGQGNDGDVDWVSRDDQVGEWLAMAEADGVYAAMIFIADASPSWAGFDVGPASGAAIRRAYERYAVDAPVEPAPPPPVVHPPTPPPSVTLPWRFVQPCEAPIFQGSDGNFSHAGRSPGFYAIDYAPLPLSSSIYAVADGEVTYNAFNHPQEGQTGHTICITHADGFESRYCHLNQYWAPVGAHVVQSEVIGLSGAPDYPYPGANGFGSGPHLHFSILKWGRWVRVETLMAEGEMAPIGVTGSRIEAAEEVDMLVETGFDDAELERLWHGPKSERQCEAAPYHADWGIPQAWAAQLTAGRPLGFAVSGEESDEASGRVVQYFANGKITYFTGDDSVAIN
jgi:murein DD-endopeptidase MepM/ murein hydrolase activator NlpD